MMKGIKKAYELFISIFDKWNIDENYAKVYVRVERDAEYRRLSNK